MIIFKRKVLRLGRSLVISIPEEIVDALNIQKGDTLKIKLENNGKKKVVIYAD